MSGTRLQRLWTLWLVGLLVAAPVAGLTAATGTAAATDASLDLAASDGSVEAGQQVTLEFTLTNTGRNESVAPVVQLASLPDGWRVVNETSPNATYRASTREWLWLSLAPGETATVSVTISVPANASGGTTGLAVTVADADNVTDTATAAVSVTGTGDGGDGSDNDPPEAVINGTTTAVAGENVTLRGTNSTDPDGEIVEYRWDLDGDGQFETSGETVDRRFPSGTTEVTLQVIDDDGTPESTTVTVVVGETQVRTTQLANGIRVTVRNMTANETVRSALVPPSDASVGAVRVTLTPTRTLSRLDLEFRTRESPPGSVTALTRAGVVSYVTITTNGTPAAAIDSLSFRLSVARSALPEDATSENLTVYAYRDGQWEALDASLIANATTDTSLVYGVELETLDPLAVAVARSQLEIMDVRTNTTTVTAGDEVSVRVTVRNAGSAPTSRTLEVTAAGEPVARRTVSLDPGERTTVFIPVQLTEPGDRTVTVANESVSVTVQPAMTRVSPTRTATETPPPTTGTTTTGPGFTPVTLLVAIGTALGIAGLRRFERDET